jgi:hypothetical protein
MYFREFKIKALKQNKLKYLRRTQNWSFTRKKTETFEKKSKFILKRI